MSLKDSIHKAALLVDLKNDLMNAIELLRNSLDKRDDDNNAVDVIKTKVFLGELLFEDNKIDESVKHFQDSIKIFSESEIEPDLVDLEIKRAKELIERISYKG
ncbi:MAG: hypothetical protein MUC29_15025 [Pyrinomonadaceae bacterium]|jgi:hypothetical protein|nr:hypothetical protein [Pyrinomonadaceae bacterium]